MASAPPARREGGEPVVEVRWSESTRGACARKSPRSASPPDPTSARQSPTSCWWGGCSASELCGLLLDVCPLASRDAWRSSSSSAAALCGRQQHSHRSIYHASRYGDWAMPGAAVLTSARAPECAMRRTSACLPATEVGSHTGRLAPSRGGGSSCLQLAGPPLSAPAADGPLQELHSRPQLTRAAAPPAPPCAWVTPRPPPAPGRWRPAPPGPGRTPTPAARAACPRHAGPAAAAPPVPRTAGPAPTKGFRVQGLGCSVPKGQRAAPTKADTGVQRWVCGGTDPSAASGHATPRLPAQRTIASGGQRGWQHAAPWQAGPGRRTGRRRPEPPPPPGVLPTHPTCARGQGAAESRA